MEPEAVRVIVVHDGRLLLMKRNKPGRQYYTLVGGHIEPDETPLAAMVREVDEETGLRLANPRLVYWQQPAGQYNKQHIFTADYAGGDIAIRPDADEARLNAAGRNTYQPVWVPLGRVAELPFLPSALRDRVLRDVRRGFPAEPITITLKGVE